MRQVKIIKIFLVAILLIVSYGSGFAADIDAMLAKAKTEKKIVMLEVGSRGCNACEQMRTVISKLSSAYKDRLEVISIDVRKDANAAWDFGVFGIPTQVFLDQNGKEFHRHVGYYDYESIVPVLKKAGI